MTDLGDVQSKGQQAINSPFNFAKWGALFTFGAMLIAGMAWFAFSVGRNRISPVLSNITRGLMSLGSQAASGGSPGVSGRRVS